MSAKPKLEIVPREPEQNQQTQREERQPQESDPAIGKWYWMKVKDYDENDASEYGSGKQFTQRQLPNHSVGTKVPSK